MRLIVPVFAATCILLAGTHAQATRIRRGPTAGHQHHNQKTAHPAASHPRAIDDERATQIQGALVKAGYLNEASGHWDTNSEAAMEKMQSDNGWQTKIVPDSRALIKLGLGPNSEASEATPAKPVPGPNTDTEAAGGR